MTRAYGECVLLTDLDALKPFEAEWRALAVARDNPQLTPELYKAWVRSYEPDVQPFVPVVLDEDGRLRGLIPLGLSRGVMRHVQLAATSFWSHAEPVARPQDQEEIATLAGRRLASSRSEWRAFSLDCVEQGAAWVDRLLGTLSDEYAGRLIETRTEYPWFLIDTSGGYDSYLDAKSGQFRRKLRKAERRLAEAHDVTVRQTQNGDQLAADLDTLFSLHLLRRQPLGGTTFEDARLRAMLEDFAAGALAQGWLRLRFMALDGETASAFLSFRVGDRCTAYVFGWDPKWTDLALGRLAYLDAIRAAADEGVSVFDLQIGQSEFKTRHGTIERTAETVWLYPRRTAVLLAARRGARRFLPQSVRRRVGT